MTQVYQASQVDNRQRSNFLLQHHISDDLRYNDNPESESENEETQNKDRLPHVQVCITRTHNYPANDKTKGYGASNVTKRDRRVEDASLQAECARAMR